MKAIGVPRMSAAAGLALAMAASLLPGSSASAVTLHRGMNTFPWFYRAKSVDNQGKTYIIPNTFPYFDQYSAAAFAPLRQAGLDFIRIPVEPNPFLVADDTQRAALLQQVRAGVERVNKLGMTAIVDLHPREAMPDWHADQILGSSDKVQRYQDVLVAFAEMLTQMPHAKVVLELMNEPPGGWSWHEGYDWFAIQKQLLHAVRAVAPTLPVILAGNRGDSIDGLLKLDPRGMDDPNIIYSFHYYDPMILTHQGAGWGSTPWRQFIDGVQYPPSKADEAATLDHNQSRVLAGVADQGSAAQMWGQAETALRAYYETQQGAARIDADFKRVSDWARAHAIPPSRIILGEFGALRPGASPASVANYARDVRSAAEHYGFAWAYFNYEPNESLPAFSILRQSGPNPKSLDPQIVGSGLGLQPGP